MRTRFARKCDPYAILDACEAGARLVEDTLSRLRPEDLEPVWRYIDSLERAGWVRSEKASRWKDAIVEQMESFGLDARSLLSDAVSIRGPLPN